ncbi:hypothetical protein L596_016600 [Steinernema carpocapsae]|uniref:Uncharacterized protein n=1 Tax=Steinernema carpocapsae TaxID=34508 RepID=A0A4U5NJP0_STECR|nr:hypothetical protein L596_016600 [Steinernema carpocapsae]
MVNSIKLLSESDATGEAKQGGWKRSDSQERKELMFVVETEGAKVVWPMATERGPWLRERIVRWLPIEVFSAPPNTTEHCSSRTIKMSAFRLSLMLVAAVVLATVTRNRFRREPRRQVRIRAQRRLQSELRKGRSNAVAVCLAEHGSMYFSADYRNLTASLNRCTSLRALNRALHPPPLPRLPFNASSCHETASATPEFLTFRLQNRSHGRVFSSYTIKMSPRHLSLSLSRPLPPKGDRTSEGTSAFFPQLLFEMRAHCDDVEFRNSNLTTREDGDAAAEIRAAAPKTAQIGFGESPAEENAEFEGAKNVQETTEEFGAAIRREREEPKTRVEGRYLDREVVGKLEEQEKEGRISREVCGRCGRATDDGWSLEMRNF